MAIIDDSQLSNWGIARTQSPTNKNYALKWSTFETIVGVNQPEVQWASLILEEPPSWSWLTSEPGKYAGGTPATECHYLWFQRSFARWTVLTMHTNYWLLFGNCSVWFYCETIDRGTWVDRLARVPTSGHLADTTELAAHSLRGKYWFHAIWPTQLSILAGK